MVKVLLVLMLCGATVVAEPTSRLPDAWAPLDTLWSVPRDTTRNYIKEIKQKCDTTLVRITDNICDSGILRCGCGHYATHTTKIKCVDDTVWAEKVQVWLTPEQLKELMRIIERLKL